MAIIKVKTGGITADAITDALIADDVVGTEHLTANEVDTTALGADAVTGAQLADNAVNSEHYTDGSVDTAHIADAQITTAKLSTAVFTGATDIGAAIADADLFLVDDGAGGTLRKSAASRLKTYVGSNTPAFFAHSASDQGSVGDNTYVKVTLGTEVFDVGSCFASSRFTVPSGEAGKYFLFGSVRCHVGSNSDMNQSYSSFYLNGSQYSETRMNFESNPVRYATNLIHVVMDLDVGDYVELYGAIDHAGASAIEIGSGNKGTHFGGYKIIE